jgi:hypothetical protein
MRAPKGNPVPAMRRALELWGNPLQGAPKPGENLATPPSPDVVAGEVKELVAALRADAECITAEQPDLMQLTDKQLTRIAEILKAFILGGWIVPTVEQVTPPAPEPGPTFQDAIKLAQGCHDYSGGHSGAEGEAWHGAIGTVVGVLKRPAAGSWDSQLTAVYGVGVEPQAGEVGA